jgi:glucose-6-phosphate 1-dehydrogenase
LAKKKIYPTLWWLYRDGLLPPSTTFCGYARTQLTVDELRSRCEKFMKVKDEEKEKYEQFWKLNQYAAGSYTERRDFEMLNQTLSKFDTSDGAANRLFYLALPPSVFEAVTVHIRNTCMALQ